MVTEDAGLFAVFAWPIVDQYGSYDFDWDQDGTKAISEQARQANVKVTKCYFFSWLWPVAAANQPALLRIFNSYSGVLNVRNPPHSSALNGRFAACCCRTARRRGNRLKTDQLCQISKSRKLSCRMAKAR